MSEIVFSQEVSSNENLFVNWECSITLHHIILRENVLVNIVKSNRKSTNSFFLFRQVLSKSKTIKWRCYDQDCLFYGLPKTSALSKLASHLWVAMPDEIKHRFQTAARDLKEKVSENTIQSEFRFCLVNILPKKEVISSHTG